MLAMFVQAEIIGGGGDDTSGSSQEVAKTKETQNNHNDVNMTHYTESFFSIDYGVLFGKIELSSTTTVKDKELPLIYSFEDSGIDVYRTGFGYNLDGWFGQTFGVRDDYMYFSSRQISPWAHYETSIGLRGIGLSGGVDVGATSYDLSVTAGLGTLLLIPIFVTVVESGGGAFATASKQ